MKKLLIALVAIIFVVLTTTTVFASGDGVCNDEGRRTCTEQCIGEGAGQMNRWQHRYQKMTQCAEVAMGTTQRSA